MKPLAEYDLSKENEEKLYKEFAKYFCKYGTKALSEAVCVVSRTTRLEGHCLAGFIHAHNGLSVDSILKQLQSNTDEVVICIADRNQFLEWIRETSRIEGYTVPPALVTFLEADTRKLRSVCWDGSSWYAGLVEI